MGWGERAAPSVQSDCITLHINACVMLQKSPSAACCTLYDPQLMVWAGPASERCCGSGGARLCGISFSPTAPHLPAVVSSGGAAGSGSAGRQSCSLSLGSRHAAASPGVLSTGRVNCSISAAWPSFWRDEHNEQKNGTLLFACPICIADGRRSVPALQHCYSWSWCWAVHPATC